MKRITLALILCLGATIVCADEYDVVDYDIFRSVDPLAQRDEWGLAPSGTPCNCHRLRATLQVAMVLLLHGQRAINFATGLRGFDADSVAPAGLLLRARGRGIHSAGGRSHRTTAKELFHARHRDAYRFRPARIAYALRAQAEAVSNPHLETVNWRPHLPDYALCVKDLAKRLK